MTSIDVVVKIAPNPLIDQLKRELKTTCPKQQTVQQLLKELINDQFLKNQPQLYVECNGTFVNDYEKTMAEFNSPKLQFLLQIVVNESSKKDKKNLYTSQILGQTMINLIVTFEGSTIHLEAKACENFRDLKQTILQKLNHKNEGQFRVDFGKGVKAKNQYLSFLTLQVIDKDTRNVWITLTKSYKGGFYV